MSRSRSKRSRSAFSRRPRSRNSFKRRRYGGSGTPLTYDNDFKTDYVYKRMPARRRKRYVRFVKKVRSITDRSQGLKKHLFQDVNRITSANDSVGFFSSMLYTPDAQVDGMNADMGTMFRSILGTSPYDNINNIALDSDTDKKILFESAVMDVTWKNEGSNTVIIDLYYIRTRKTFGLTGVDASNNTHGIYELGMRKQGQVEDIEDSVTLGSNKITPSQFGVTPFMSSLFCQTFKILSKKRITIAPGNFVSMTLKDPRNRTVNATDTRARICMAGLTHGYFYQFYGVPGVSTLVDRYSLGTTLLVTCVKKYNYYLPVSGKDQTAVQPQ